MDIANVCLFCGVLLLLTVATVALRSLLKYTDYGVDPAIIETFRPRIRIWWILFGLLACVFFLGPFVTVIFFFLLSLTILREYITLTPKSPADHRTLFGIYLFFTPLQFTLVGINPDWFMQATGFTPYQVFSILLPGYVFLVLPGMMAISGDPKRFLERTAKLQLGLIICVYSLSYVPALLTLNLPNAGTRPETAVATVLNRNLEETIIESLGGLNGQDAVVRTQEYQEYDVNDANNSDTTSIPNAPWETIVSGEETALIEERHIEERYNEERYNEERHNGETDSAADSALGEIGQDDGIHQNSSHHQDSSPNGEMNGLMSDSQAPQVQTSDDRNTISPDTASQQVLRAFPITTSQHFQLLFFFFLIVQCSDVFQYLGSRASRQHIVADQINSTRTWKGVLVGILATALLGVVLWYFTPFPFWWQAGLVAMIVAAMGFLGSMTMSAIKRDRGVGSYGALIPGHSSFLDRLDSLCFAAPVFYHCVWFFTT